MTRAQIVVTCTMLCSTLALRAFAQEVTPTHVSVPDVPANAEDVKDIDGVMKAFYEVISGPAGKPRQWSRDRSLYIPGVRFVTMAEDKSGKPQATIVTHQEYVDSANASFVKHGFFENEIHRVTERFGNIAQIFSTYETREKGDGPVNGRGINSIQLYFDGTRWWISSVAWDDERPDNRLPPKYLP
jgi:hypothetical protein